MDGRDRAEARAAGNRQPSRRGRDRRLALTVDQMQTRAHALDPALTRPGRMGRHVWFRTPTKSDRLDIFDLYIDKVDHDPDLDRDLLAAVGGRRPVVGPQAERRASAQGEEDVGAQALDQGAIMRRVGAEGLAIGAELGVEDGGAQSGLPACGIRCI